MAKNWTLQRLTAETVARLRKMQAELEKIADQGRVELPAEQHGVTIDWLVNELLDRRDNHKARAKRSAQGRRPLRITYYEAVPRLAEAGPEDAQAEQGKDQAPSGLALYQEPDSLGALPHRPETPDRPA